MVRMESRAVSQARLTQLSAETSLPEGWPARVPPSFGTGGNLVLGGFQHVLNAVYLTEVAGGQCCLIHA